MSFHYEKDFQCTVYHFEPPNQARHWYIGASLAEGHEDGQGLKHLASEDMLRVGLVGPDRILSISKKMLLRRWSQDNHGKL